MFDIYEYIVYIAGISRLTLPSGTKGFGGTEGFMAPEIMRYNGEEEYTEKVILVCVCIFIINISVTNVLKWIFFQYCVFVFLFIGWLFLIWNVCVWTFNTASTIWKPWVSQGVYTRRWKASSDSQGKVCKTYA